MAVKTSWYATDTALGINFNATYAGSVAVAASVTSTGNINQDNLVVANDLLGTSRTGTDNSQWVLVKASTTITQFNLVCWDDSYNANNFTTALGLAGNQLGIAQFQTFGGQTLTSADPSTNPVFWAAIRGTGMQISVSGSAGTGVALSNGTAPGLVTVSATGSQIRGLALVASAGASAFVEVAVTYPRMTLFG